MLKVIQTGKVGTDWQCGDFCGAPNQISIKFLLNGVQSFTKSIMAE